MSLNQGFSEAGEQFGEGNGVAMLGPRSAIHTHVELAVRRKSTMEQNFKIFISVIILDRNSQVCFHKAMVTDRVMKANRARCRARDSM